MDFGFFISISISIISSFLILDFGQIYESTVARHFLCVIIIVDFSPSFILLEEMDEDGEGRDRDMEQAVWIYAMYLGIDLDEEKDMILIAEKALNTLPRDWQLGFGEPDSEHPGVPYFYNTATEESRWTHPKEQVYFEMVQKERAKQSQEKDKGKGKKKKASTEEVSTAKIGKSGSQGAEVMTIEEFDDGEEDKRPPQKNTQSTNRKSNEMSSFGLSETDFDDVDNVIELVEQEPGQFDSLYITFVQVNSSHS